MAHNGYVLCVCAQCCRRDYMDGCIYPAKNWYEYASAYTSHMVCGKNAHSVCDAHLNVDLTVAGIRKRKFWFVCLHVSVIAHTDANAYACFNMYTRVNAIVHVVGQRHENKLEYQHSSVYQMSMSMPMWVQTPHAKGNAHETQMQRSMQIQLWKQTRMHTHMSLQKQM